MIKMENLISFKKKIVKFKKYHKDILVGTIAGLISGIFFSVYNDLRSQFNSTFFLLGASLLTATIWYLIILFLSFIFFLILEKK